jgi:hypothetical protein
MPLRAGAERVAQQCAIYRGPSLVAIRCADAMAGLADGSSRYGLRAKLQDGRVKVERNAQTLTH